MGHGKETPRQKMIGMMYLVLTALLALNVSAEVLNAFILVNESLTKTIDNTTTKNQGVYAGFKSAYDVNPTKVGDWYKNAQSIQTLAQSLNDTIMGYKRRIVQIADKREEWNDTLFAHVMAKDDNNVPGQVMILEQNGERLKEQINEFREKMISLLDTTKVPDLAASIRSTFNTADVVGNAGAKVSWSRAYFDNLPLMGVITILSKIQTDIRNAESDVVSYFFGQISADDWKFNKIEAFVNAPKSYVLKDGKYEADVFIAASDSTVDPKIIIQGGQELKIVNGKGKYVGSTSTIGAKRWKGVIKYPSPSGVILDFPFEAEYEVGEPSLAVSPTKMNVFYLGVDNPVEISASGVPSEAVKATISNGTLSKVGDGWVVRVSKGTETFISAIADVDGKSKELGKKKFRIKRVPDPVAMVGTDKNNARGGVINRTALMAQAGVKADLENFDFDLKFVVSEFTVSATLAGGYVEEAKSTDARFTAKQKQIMQQVKSGQKIYIENIVAVGPDKVPRKLGSIVFKVM